MEYIKKDGKYEEYYKDEQLLVICNYINDKKEGEYNEYYTDGQLEMICNYINDKKRGLNTTSIIQMDNLK